MDVNIRIAVIVLLIFFVVVILMKNKASPEKNQPMDLAKEAKALRFLELGNEITSFDSLLYDGPESEGYAENYRRKLGVKEVELVIKYGRGLDCLPFIFDEEDVDQVGAKIKHQRENSLHFHINNGCLVLVFGEEINNGRWYCEIIAAWELPDLNNLLEKFLSRDSTQLRDATFDVLYCSNDEILKSLITDLEKIQVAMNETKSTGMVRDNRDYTRRAIESVKTIQDGGCRCSHYSSDPFCSVRPLEQYGLITISHSVLDKENYCQRFEVVCDLCKQHYNVVEQPGGHVEHYTWTKK